MEPLVRSTTSSWICQSEPAVIRGWHGPHIWPEIRTTQNQRLTIPHTSCMANCNPKCSMQYYLQDAEICPSERASAREREREGERERERENARSHPWFTPVWLHHQTKQAAQQQLQRLQEDNDGDGNALSCVQKPPGEWWMDRIDQMTVK